MQPSQQGGQIQRRGGFNLKARCQTGWRGAFGQGDKFGHIVSPRMACRAVAQTGSIARANGFGRGMAPQLGKVGDPRARDMIGQGFKRLKAKPCVDDKAAALRRVGDQIENRGIAGARPCRRSRNP